MLTDPDVVRRHEVTFESPIRPGFALEDATWGLVLLHYLTIGFCVEEQAVAQVTASGDSSYSPEHRAELIGPDTAPLAVEAGLVILGDPGHPLHRVRRPPPGSHRPDPSPRT